MLSRLLGFWASIPLAIFLGLAPGIWVTEWWEHQTAVPRWACVHVWFVHWCPVTPLVAQEGKLRTEYASLLAREEAARRAAVELQARQDAISTAVILHDAQAQRIIQTVIRTITREVPIYVTAATDTHYPVPWGLVRLHDAGALGVDPASLPNPSGAADDTPSTVTDGNLAATLTTNYGICRSTTQQLTDLQAWVRSQAEANPHKKQPP